jgi:hypothetical protein
MMSGQLHATAALCPRKEPQYPLDRRLSNIKTVARGPEFSATPNKLEDAILITCRSSGTVLGKLSAPIGSYGTSNKREKYVLWRFTM